MRIKIYVEGGGDSDALRTACRSGFSRFFAKTGLEDARRMPSIVACGSRDNAYSDFCTALRKGDKDVLPLLLVDSEALVAPEHGPWEHLAALAHWRRPSAANDEHVYLMAVCMETWLLADPDALKAYYEQGFKASALPRQTALEEVQKDDVFNALHSATRGAGPKGEYRKSKHSFDLLAQISPALVRQKCPQADRLILFLLRR